MKFIIFRGMAHMTVGVDMYIVTFSYICVFICTCLDVCVYVYMCGCVYMYMCIYLYVFASVPVGSFHNILMALSSFK